MDFVALLKTKKMGELKESLHTAIHDTSVELLKEQMKIMCKTKSKVKKKAK